MRDFEAYCWNNVISRELLTIYSPYRRERAIPQRPAILILHPKIGTQLAVQPEWVTAAARIVESARASTIPVLHSVPPDGAATRSVGWSDDELVIPRPRESAFLFSELAAVLTSRGIAGLILCGATTSGAVRATAVEAKSYAYRAAIAEEATGDEASLLHKTALFDIAHKYADVMSLAEMLQMIDGRGSGSR